MHLFYVCQRREEGKGLNGKLYLVYLELGEIWFGIRVKRKKFKRKFILL